MSTEKSSSRLPDNLRVFINEKDLGNNNVFEVILRYAGLENLSEEAKDYFRNNSDPEAYGRIVRLANEQAGLESKSESINDESRQGLLDEINAQKAYIEGVASYAARSKDKGGESVDAELAPDVEAPEAGPAPTPLIVREHEETAALIGGISDPIESGKSYPAKSSKEKKGRKSLGRVAATFTALLATGTVIFGATHSQAPERAQAEAAHSAEAQPGVILTDHEASFFQEQDPSDLLSLKKHINNFGPPSEALRHNDRQGTLDNWSKLFRGKINGAEIMTTYLAALHMGDAPVRPSLDQMTNPTVYYAYMDARRAYAEKLKADPKHMGELYDKLMSELGKGEFDPNTHMMQGASDFVYKNADPKDPYYNHVLTDLSVASLEEYRIVYVPQADGSKITLYVKIDCDQQLGEENLHPISTPVPQRAPEIIAPVVNARPLVTIVPRTPQAHEQPKGHGGGTPPSGGGTPPPTGGGTPPPEVTPPNTPKYEPANPDHSVSDSIKAGEPTKVDPIKDLQPQESVKKPKAEPDRGPHMAVPGQAPNDSSRAPGASSSSSSAERGSDGSFSGPAAQAGSNPNKSTPASTSSGSGGEGSGSSSSAGSGGESAGGSPSRNTHVGE